MCHFGALSALESWRVIEDLFNPIALFVDLKINSPSLVFKRSTVLTIDIPTVGLSCEPREQKIVGPRNCHISYPWTMFLRKALVVWRTRYRVNRTVPTSSSIHGFDTVSCLTLSV